ncbi:MAG TPA: hypothetical protein VGL91_12985 [Acidobacteriota bacterium]|jgi:hypothetical protein
MKIKLVVPSAIFSLSVAFGLLAQERPAVRTITGKLVDSKCYVEGFAENTHMGIKDCGTQCAKSGIPVALVNVEGSFTTILAPSLALAEYIGQEARITGRVDAQSRTIIPDKVEVRRGDQWQEVKLRGTM